MSNQHENSSKTKARQPPHESQPGTCTQRGDIRYLNDMRCHLHLGHDDVAIGSRREYWFRMHNLTSREFNVSNRMELCLVQG